MNLLMTSFRKRRFIALSLFLLAAAVVLLGGCGATRPSKYYQLTVPPDSPPSANANQIPVTLLIGRLTAPELYREDQIVYSSGEDTGTYEYHRWAEPPTAMIQEILLRQLRASGQFHGVYLLRSDMRGDYLLHGHLYDFKQVTGSSLVARVTMELELQNIKTGESIWSHFYTHDEPVSSKDIGAVVEALDKSVQQGVAEFRADLEQYFAAHPQAHPAS